MASNRQFRDGPIGKLSDYVGESWIWLHCPACAHATKNDPLDLLERLGDMPVARLVQRAKCQRCGRRGAQLTLASAVRPDRSDAPRKRPDMPGLGRR